MDGVTRRYELDGSMPRRSAFGPEMRAQSSGERPARKATLRLGFWGLDECVGGGARPPEDGFRRPRLGTGPRARCAEPGAGNRGSRPGGGITEKPGVGGESSDKEKRGTACRDVVAEAFGVVGLSGSWTVVSGRRTVGGGMASAAAYLASAELDRLAEPFK